MLIPLQLRLCGLSAMAPALTETASQASNFKPPYSPPARAQEPPGLLEEHDYQHLALDLRKEASRVGDPKGSNLFPILTAKNVDVTFSTDLVALLDKATASNSSSQFFRSYRRFSAEPPSSEDGGARQGTGDGNGDSDRLTERTMNSGEGGGDDNNDSSSECTMGMLKASANLRFAEAKLEEGGIVASAAVAMDREATDVVAPDNAVPERALGCRQEDLETVARSRLQGVRQRQTNIERLTDSLLRRLKRLQMKQMEHHVTDQVAGLVAQQEKVLQLPADRERHRKALHRYGRGGDLKSEFLQRENVKNLSTAALVTLVRKLESSGGSVRQKYVTLQQQQQHPRSNDRIELPGSVVKIPKEVCDEMDRVAGTLQMNLSNLKSTVDSDATDSSSGGESCDELDGYDEKKSHNVPIYKRAAWKWAIDRASVASRWTWLQAQVSDLEYRIRQQNELYRQLRASKGVVTLAGPCGGGDDSLNHLTTAHPSRLGCKESSSSMDVKPAVLERRNDIDISSLLCSVEAKGLRLQNNGSRHPSHINGFVNSGSITSACDPSSSDANEKLAHLGGEAANSSGSARSSNDATCTASRTRPLVSFRKRKVLRTAGLYQINKKAAKLSNIRCGCIPPLTPCTMCGGRVNNIHQVDPDVSSVEERLGLLDSAFHPILSLDQDVALHLHFESLLKNGDWQKTTQKQKFSPSKKKSRLTPANSDHVHKHSRKLKKNAAATLTAKFKKKYGDEKRQKKKNSTVNSSKDNTNFERIRKKHNLNQIQTAYKKRERSLSGSSGSSSKPASPVPSLHGSDIAASHLLGPHSGLDKDRRSSMLQELMRKRRGESAFDINNIVIPYSMAASTRVERLQYKEILTPKWRLIEDIVPEEPEVKEMSSSVVPSDQGSSKDAIDEPIEDLTDDIFIIRHNKCEEEERKRFMSYLQTHNTNRSRSRNMRMDSRADSSGANTPDPLSPFPMDLQLEHQDSPLTTPPSTPAPLVIDDNSNFAVRRRTTSVSKRDRSVEDLRAATPEPEEDPIPPWDSRTFPLSDVEMEEMLKVHQQMPSPSPRLLLNPEQQQQQQQPLGSPSVMQLEASSNQPLSPLSSSSTSLVGDDPNDPEWTVSPIPGEKGQRSSGGGGAGNSNGGGGIVIKLAKR